MDANVPGKTLVITRVFVITLVVLALVFSMVPASASASTLTLSDISSQKTVTRNGHTWTWRIDDNGKLVLRGAIDFGRASTATPQERDVPWFNNRLQIKSVSFESSPSFYGDVSYLLSGCQNLTRIDGLASVNTRNATGMQGMFYQCNQLTSLDVSKFVTSKVTNMQSMFYGCTRLTSLNVSGFNTSRVTSMRGMFSTCSRLASLDVSGFNTSSVNNMQSMFSGCSRLTSLNVSKFNTSNVYDMGYLFARCSSLTSLNLSNFNTSNVASMLAMFDGCSALKSLNLSSFNTSNVSIVNSMLAGTSSLSTLSLGKGWKAISASTGLSDGWYQDRNNDGYADSTAPLFSAGQVLTRGSDGLSKITYLKSSKLKPAVVPTVDERRIMTAKDDRDLAGSDFSLLQARAFKTTKSSVKLEWNKVKGAIKYVVYGNRCGKQNRYEKMKTLSASKTSFKQKGLKSKTYYKYIVVAVGKTGAAEVVLATSKTVHAATKGSSRKTNPTKVKVNKKKISLKKGKSSKVKARQLKKKGTKVNIHRKVAFESTDSSIVSVNRKGKVTAKKKGTCYVFAYAQNGKSVKVKVTVK